MTNTTTQTPSSAPSLIKLLTWNVSSWNTASGARYSLVEKHQELLRVLRDEQPDVLCLQECDLVFLAKVDSLGEWSLVGQVQTHCEWTVLFLRVGGDDAFKLVERMIRLDAMVGAVVKLPSSTSTSPQRFAFITSMHLAPFKDGDSQRRQQLRQIERMVADNERPGELLVVCAGDGNVREPEAKWFLSGGAGQALRQGSLVDAWNAAKCPKNARFTWDSYANKYHDQEAFAFRSRFDRVFLSTGFAVDEYRLVGDREFRGSYLSDHYGIMTTFHLN